MAEAVNYTLNQWAALNAFTIFHATAREPSFVAGK
jgi:hypothetical protein